MKKRTNRSGSSGRRKRLLDIKRSRWRRTQQILGVSLSLSDQRGHRAEEKALECFHYYQERKTEFPGGRIIKKAVPSLHFSPNDLAGIDIVVTFQKPNGQEQEILPIQVQNWWSLEAEKSFKEKEICLIVIWPREDREEMRRRVLRFVSDFLREKDANTNTEE